MVRYESETSHVDILLPDTVGKITTLYSTRLDPLCVFGEWIPEPLLELVPHESVTVPPDTLGT